MKKLFALLLFVSTFAFGQNYPSPTFKVLTLQTPLGAINGGTGLSSLPAGAVITGNGTGSVSAVAPGASAQALVSNGAGVSPSFQALTSPFVNYTQGGTGAVTQTVQNRLRNNVMAGDYGVVSDGATDDSTAINTALASGSVIFPRRTTVSNTFTNQSSYTWASFGGSFTGTNALDKNSPAFGPGAFRAVSSGPQNGIIGIAYDNLPPNTASFPTGVTGYGQIAAGSGGSSIFGIFGRADLRDTGVATNEFNTFNFSAAPQSALPPNRGFATGLTTPVVVTVASGGNFPSSIGVELAQEGSIPQPMLTGIYTDPNAITQNGIIIGASATQGPVNSAEFQNVGTGVNLSLTTMGTAAGTNLVFQILNNVRAVQAFMTQNGSATFNGNLTAGGTLAVTGVSTLTGGINGVISGSAAAAGIVGQIISSTAAAVPISNATPTNITSVSLTAGQWSCSGSIEFTPAATTVTTAILGSLSTTSATMGGIGARFQLQVPFTTGASLQSFPTPVVPINVSTTTTLFAVAQANFTTSTETANASISCLRVR